MISVAWYARDGHLDFLPLIAKKMEAANPSLRSFYICHHQAEQERLSRVYGIRDCFVLAQAISEEKGKVRAEADAFRDAQKHYSGLPLIRGLWSSMFEHSLSDKEMTRLFMAHLSAWRKFLEDRRIEWLFSEVPSIMSTTAAWFVCQSLGVRYTSFVNIPPLSDRVAFSSSWEGYYDGFEELLHKKPDFVPSGISVDMARRYLHNMKTHPRKTQDAMYFMDVVQKQLKKMPFSIDRIRTAPGFFRDHAKRRQYYIQRSLWRILWKKLCFRFHLFLYRWFRVFEKASSSENESFVLFPLHMWNEYSNYTWMGTGYGDQAAAVEAVSRCLPLGLKLYVKEHTSQCGEKPLSFYRRIKRCRSVRLIHPYADTFDLIRRSKGIVTFGSTMGFEAFIMDKPCLVLGRPWYRNLAGVYQASDLETLSDLLQNIGELKTAPDAEKERVVCALYETSFEGKIYPPANLEENNIQRFAAAFHEKILSVGSACETGRAPESF